MSIFNIRSHGTTSPQAFLSRVSQCLDANNLVIELISSSQQMLSLALHAPELRTLIHATQSLQGLGAISMIENISIVSVIGHRMRNVVGIGAEIFSALAGAKVNIYLIGQSASEINISYVQDQCSYKGKLHGLTNQSLVLNAHDAQVAMEVVHEKVLGIPRHEEKENALVTGPWLY
jgi:aspartate kinase